MAAGWCDTSPVDDYADAVLIEQSVQRSARTDFTRDRASEEVPDRAVDLARVNELDILRDLPAHEFGERSCPDLASVRDAIHEPVDEARTAPAPTRDKSGPGSSPDDMSSLPVPAAPALSLKGTGIVFFAARGAHIQGPARRDAAVHAWDTRHISTSEVRP